MRSQSRKYWIASIASALSFMAALPMHAGERNMKVYLTGYTYWDNTPPGSATIALPVIHKKAGGTGTYNDPLTLAVGHVIKAGDDKPDYPEGTRFYFPRLHKYAIVEDTCGDGPRPQNGPCHTGKGGKPWLDIYVGGSKMSADKSDGCSRKITGMQAAIINPGRNYPVSPGELAETCKTF